MNIANAVLDVNPIEGRFELKDVKLLQESNTLTDLKHIQGLASDIVRGKGKYSKLCTAWTRRSFEKSFVVVLEKGSTGLGIELAYNLNGVYVAGFTDDDRGGWVKEHSKVKEKDRLLAVNDKVVSTEEEFQNVQVYLNDRNPVKLVFERTERIQVVEGPVLTLDQSTQSVYHLSNPSIYPAGTAHRGVRYIMPQLWVAEISLPFGGVHRLGVYPTEKLAAEAYNGVIYAKLGAQGHTMMNIAAPFHGKNVPSVPEEPKQLVYFSAMQKLQLRSQILAFKFLANSQAVPNNVLIQAIKMDQVSARNLMQSNVGGRQPRFREPVGGSKRTSKGRSRRRKAYYSDDASSESDEDFEPVTKVAATPSRRSGRNFGKKTKKYNEDATFEDLGLSEEEKEKKIAEENAPKRPIGPQVDKLLALRLWLPDENANIDSGTQQFLVKWKNKSYHHVTWNDRSSIEALGIQNITRVTRFLQQQENQLEYAYENPVYGDAKGDDTEYFNPMFLEIDRILSSRTVGSTDTEPRNAGSLTPLDTASATKSDSVDGDWEAEAIAERNAELSDDAENENGVSINSNEAPASQIEAPLVANNITEKESIPEKPSNEAEQAILPPIGMNDAPKVGIDTPHMNIESTGNAKMEISEVANEGISIANTVQEVPATKLSPESAKVASTDGPKVDTKDDVNTDAKPKAIDVKAPTAMKAFKSPSKLAGKKPIAPTDEADGSAEEDSKPTAKKEYLIKWRGLSYVECTWESEDVISEEKKIAEYLRFNHPPIVNGAHPAMMHDVRPPAQTWAKYSDSPTYSNGNQLRNYQVESLNWMIFCWYNRRNCILADEMGLGKTIQAVSVLEHLRQREHIRGPFLVVAPLATLGNWKREFDTWTSMNCVVYHDSEGGAETRKFIRDHEFFYTESEGSEYYRKRRIFKFNVIVTSYNILVSDAELFGNIHWRYVIVDEAHKLKNQESKLLQVMRNFSWDSCLLMTGTPLQNGVFELWSLLNFIEPEKFPSQRMFYEQFGELSTAEQVNSLHNELRPYMLRRIKEDVEKSIPPKEETIIDVELTNLQKKYYRAIFEKNRSFLKSKGTGPVANLVNVEMELRKCCNHPFLIRGVEDKEFSTMTDSGNDTSRMKLVIQASGKTVLLDKMLIKFKGEGKKVLIFSQFKMMLDVLEDMLMLRHYRYERMDGNVRGNERQAAIDRFNDPESDSLVFLLSTRAGGVGINLVAASIVILFDSDWNPQNDLQAVARCHRIGQTKAVQIYRLVTIKTYEAQMFEIASKKLGMHHAVFETGGVRNGFSGADEKGEGMMSLLSLDRNKIEMMIRYGAYAIMEDEEGDPENAKMNSVDIDQLLSNSRTIRYDNAQKSEGTEDTTESDNHASSALSFSKATFVSESADSTIDFNDDKFWEKVLGPKLIQQLSSKLHNGFLGKATVAEIREYLRQLRELARAMVEERQKGEALQDAEQIMEILLELQVVGPVFRNSVNVKLLAKDWLEIIEKPKRRRNQTEDDEFMYTPFLDGPRKKRVQKKTKKEKVIGEDADSAQKKKKRRRRSTAKPLVTGLTIRLERDTDSGGYQITSMRSRIGWVKKELAENNNESDYDAMSVSDASEIESDASSPPKKRVKKSKPFICSICFSTQTEGRMQCKDCGIQVHAECYTGKSRKSKEFTCDLCASSINDIPSCAICSLSKSGPYKKDLAGNWSHVCCAYWSPALDLSSGSQVSQIEDVTKMMQDGSDAKCMVCNETGGCLQCGNSECLSTFHSVCTNIHSNSVLVLDDGAQSLLCKECSTNVKSKPISAKN